MVRGITYAPKWGECHVYIRINPEHGAPREVWVDVNHKEGSVLVGIGHALARILSLALQSGTPADVLSRALVGTTGGEGKVKHCNGVMWAESLPDLVGQVIAAHLAAQASVPA